MRTSSTKRKSQRCPWIRQMRRGVHDEVIGDSVNDGEICFSDNYRDRCEE
ncbi:hypothetical protein [Streptomyces beihaiensis]|uniref:Uncharacterized protein n=1 Tax=Streptomyces beihaiensis TaxID=2984495 RepID=A0ABT3TN85_9ACTN|nr:hypothetical protein [Streptomyces beihaiensis]MCX3058200.1 hypothetical protein [Streptomyces beihaiensis]